MLDVLVLGSGVAGLSAAIHAAAAGLRVVILTKGELAHSATRYAQGGVAAALETPDSPGLHLTDTLAAGAGLCDRDAVEVLVSEGPTRVRELVALGAEFDRTNGALAVAREGGHSLPRILHAGGDATGREIERALVHAVTERSVEVIEGWFATDLVVEHARACGVRGFDTTGTTTEVRARHVVIATGGAGQLFAVTTNPMLSTGDGIAMARRAGAAIADVEFMQFHPTALHHPAMPRPLLSEALRGEGAILRDEDGHAFMADEHPMADLAPRDVTARAIASRLRDRDLEHVWLDGTPIAAFSTRFPSIWRACVDVGLDPARDWLPVAPAAHYLSGGVCADLDGATTLAGLWAVGEAACSGVHGANRLASNSLLDGLVFAPRAVEAVVRGKQGPEPTGAMRGAPLEGTAPASEPAGHDLDGHGMSDPEALRRDLQGLMTTDAGALRDEASLERAAAGVTAVSGALGSERHPASEELRNLTTVAGALIAAALARKESRGTHTRTDHPEADPTLEGRFLVLGADPPRFVPLPQRTPA